MSSNAVVSMDKVSCHYRTGIVRKRNVEALAECSADFPESSVTAVVGANGSGKSTLMRLIANLERPFSGKIAHSHLRVPGDIAYLDQARPIFGYLSAIQNFEIARTLNPRWDSEWVGRVVKEFDIDLTRKVNQLSEGQRAVIALLVALGKRPKLSLLDEPAGALDPLVRQRVLRLILSEAAETGSTFIIATHDLSEIDSICDRMVMMLDGRARRPVAPRCFRASETRSARTTR